MGWRILRWWWRSSPTPVFVQTGRDSTVFFRVRTTSIRIRMADAYIPSFGLKGPEESLPKNFDASGALATVGSPTVTSYSVVVVEGGAELIIADVAYDVVTKRLSFTMAGGTVGVIYYVRCRVSGVGFKFDQTATIEVVART